MLAPVLAYAQEEEKSISPNNVFKAEVVEILEEKIVDRSEGSKAKQQNILLKGLEGEWKDREITYHGVSDIDVVSANSYKIGDVVFVSEVHNIYGETEYYINELARSRGLFLLLTVFVVAVVLIGKIKGVKSLLSLFVSFLIIIFFIVPKILAGANPLFVSMFGSLVILWIIIYFTEGWNRKSHVSFLSVFVSLLFTLGFSWFFTNLFRLTGMAQEETIFLLGANNGAINFKGLLLAGILIGTVGVLDDVIVGQSETVRQIKKANPKLSKKQVYRAAFEVGNTHLGAIVNTLFLTYAGVGLPLLLLFYLNPTGTATFSQMVSNELVATEIVRTLAGGIGVALSMPISTFLATIWLEGVLF